MHHLSPITRLTVRWRLTLWYLAMMAVALLVFGGIVYAWQASRIHAQMQSDVALLQQQAGQFAVDVPPPPPGAGAVTIAGSAAGASNIAVIGSAADDRRPSATMVNETERGATFAGAPPPPGPADITLVIGPQGQIVQRSGPIGSGDVQRILSEVSTATVGDQGIAFPVLGMGGVAQSPADYQFYAQHIVVGDGGPGTLILGRPSAAVGELQRLMLTLFAAGVVSLLVVGAAGYWLAGRAMRPVRVITRAAREIGETDLSRRLELPNRDELGELAATFDSMLARLEAAFARQRQFTNDASHELRTPLTIVELEVERALARPALPPALAQPLLAIRGETAAMSHLVNSLLTLARADASQAPLEHERIDLGDVVLEATERLVPLARERGISITVTDLPELPVDGNRQLLMQMVGNLLENAVKYTAGHGHEAVIEAGQRQGQIWLRVSDDGPGIPAEHLPYLFERFYRVDQSRSERDDGHDGQPRGSGLGLAIARWVARAHGGDIDVASSVGEGSHFTARLPIAQPVADEAAGAFGKTLQGGASNDPA